MSRINEIHTELERLAALDTLNDEQQAAWSALEAEAEKIHADNSERAAKVTVDRSAVLERIGNYISEANTETGTDGNVDVKVERVAAPNVNRIADPWDGLDIRRAAGPDLISRAAGAVEMLRADDNVAENLTRMIEGNARLQEGDEGDLARLTLATVSPGYRKAFSRYLKRGAEGLNDEDRSHLDRALGVQRAMSTTDNAGGYLIPTHIEPAVVMTADGVQNPFFELGRVIPTTSDTLRAVGSGNASWSWDSENAEVSDDTTTFANTDIPLYTARGFVPVSIEALQSIANAEQVVQDVLMGGHADLLSAALTTGSGSSQPTGVITAVTGQATASATTDTFAVADVYAIYEKLPAKYRTNATWASNIAALADIRQFATDDGHALLARLGEGVNDTRILGRPWREASGMDGVINATADNYYLLFGDLSYYWIGQGIGTTVEYVPQVFGGNGRPIGARGWFAYHRFGADSVNDSAFELLNVT